MGKSKSRIFIATIAALALFLTPLLTGFSYTYNHDNSNYHGCILCEASKNINLGNSNCETCLDQETIKQIKDRYDVSAEEIKGAEASKYVNMVNNYEGIKKQTENQRSSQSSQS
ncbi:MAG: hypothetical protein K9L17_03455 [Clostridiales bacterium]|nr:hypothetical protein [Clostridiales bacterium]MCF8021736.1 hypothetical protein [Clostridiales bacterium]